MSSNTRRTLVATLIVAASVAVIPSPAGGDDPHILKMRSPSQASFTVHDDFRVIAGRESFASTYSFPEAKPGAQAAAAKN